MVHARGYKAWYVACAPLKPQFQPCKLRPHKTPLGRFGDNTAYAIHTKNSKLNGTNIFADPFACCTKIKVP